MNLGNRVINNNVNNVNVNRWNQYNRNWNANRPWWGRPGYWNRPWYGGRPAWYWSRPWYCYHYGWHSGYWNYWTTAPAIWLGASATAGWLLSPGDTYVYSNPYYVAPATTTIVYDYSRALPAPAPDQMPVAYPPDPEMQEDGAPNFVPGDAPPPPDTTDPAIKEANRYFDEARAAFKRNDYAKALEQVDAAITKLPSDATLHEFRGLVLFAQGKFKDAAATLYAVLAAGPGWDWQTMRDLYPNVDTYTRQLRALEAEVKQNTDAAYLHFLLAYHYLVLGSKEPAIKQLQEVVRIEPKDQLSAALLKSLTTAESGAPAGAAPPPG